MIQSNFKHYTIQTPTKQHAKGMAALQKVVFATLSDEELISESDYISYLSFFPEGQLVVLDGTKIIGASTTFRYNYHPGFHTFLEITGNMSLSNHDPNGKWIYGVDVSIDPNYQRQGIGGAIYQLRQQIAQQLGCKGQLTVGMTNGYYLHKNDMIIEEYCKKLEIGELKDPTVSAQMKNGFRWIEPFFNYLNDSKSGNAGISMYWPIDLNMTIADL
jgi:GNAT superfamily N-acetyltransferase